MFCHIDYSGTNLHSVAYSLTWLMNLETGYLMATGQYSTSHLLVFQTDMGDKRLRRICQGIVKREWLIIKWTFATNTVPHVGAWAFILNARQKKLVPSRYASTYLCKDQDCSSLSLIQFLYKALIVVECT